MKSTAITVALLLATIAAAGCAGAPKCEPVAERPSLTIYPVRMAGEDREDVATVVAALLEQRGLDTIEVEQAAFAPRAGAPFEEQAEEFAAVVQRRGLSTRYALHGSVLGTPSTGAEEIRTVLVDGEGHVAWSDRQTRQSPAMRRARPADPMECSVFIAERLRGPLALGTPRQTDGPWAEHLRSASLAPTQEQLVAMDARLARLRAAAPSATVLVYPARTGKAWSATCAQRLAEEINRRGLLDASTADAPLAFEIQPSRNEQRVLWSGARSLQALVQAGRPAADYMLVADYAISPRSGEVLAVHTYLLDASGELVIVDYQNSHQDDFRRIGPRSLEDCCSLSAVRLEEYFRR